MFHKILIIYVCRIITRRRDVGNKSSSRFFCYAKFVLDDTSRRVGLLDTTHHENRVCSHRRTCATWREWMKSRKYLWNVGGYETWEVASGCTSILLLLSPVYDAITTVSTIVTEAGGLNLRERETERPPIVGGMTNHRERRCSSDMIVTDMLTSRFFYLLFMTLILGI